MLADERCPLCGSSDVELIGDVKHSAELEPEDYVHTGNRLRDRSLWRRAVYSMRCNACGQTFDGRLR